MLVGVVHHLGGSRKSAREGCASRLFCFNAGFSGSPNGVRSGADQDSSVPVHKPAGTYVIGGDSEAYQSLPKRSVKIAGFRIGRFPVTVWEYGKYLEETRAEP